MRHLFRLLPGRRPRTVAPSRQQVDARYRAERRAVARRLHPDRGGDVEQYLAALAEVDRRHDDAVRPRPRTTTRRRSVKRRIDLLALHARTRLPRGVPGARRYGRL